MKKFIIYILTAVLTISTLAGCASTGESGSQTEAKEPAIEPANKLEKILAEGKITMVTSPDFPPYEFVDMTKTGQESIVGADVELAKFIAEKLGVELVVESMTFDAVLASVTEGKADLAISGLTYKEDRAAAMELSDYYNQGGYQGIMVLKTQLDQYKTAEDFSGKKIGAQNASLQYENVETQLPDAKIEIITSVAEGVMMLQGGKIDCLAMSGVTGDQYCANYTDIAMSEFRFETSDAGNCIGITKGETELLEKINEIIEEVNAEDKYAEWRDAAVALSEELGVK